MIAQDISTPRIASARPGVTTAIMAETGLDEKVLRNMVHRFYARVRADDVLGPVFADRISDWGRHLERMVAFWSSMALMTGRYHGRPVPAHAPLPIDASHFNRWLGLFRETAQKVCTPVGAKHVIERAEQIARSLHIAVEEAQAAHGAVPSLCWRKDAPMTGLEEFITDLEEHMRLENEALFPQFEPNGVAHV